MKYQIQSSEIALLRKAGVPEDDIRHCLISRMFSTFLFSDLLSAF